MDVLLCQLLNEVLEVVPNWPLFLDPGFFQFRGLQVQIEAEFLFFAIVLVPQELDLPNSAEYNPFGPTFPIAGQ